LSAALHEDLSTIFDDAGRNSRDDGKGWDAFGNHCARGNDGSVSDGDTLKNDAVNTNPDVRADEDNGAGFWLMFDGHGNAGAVVMVDEAGAAGDKAGVPNLNAAERVELTPAANEALVPDIDADDIAVAAGDFEVNLTFEVAVEADANAMRPGYTDATKTSSGTDAHAEAAPVQPTESAAKEEQIVPTDAKDKLSTENAYGIGILIRCHGWRVHGLFPTQGGAGEVADGLAD
jgi:hypothetical protein